MCLLCRKLWQFGVHFENSRETADFPAQTERTAMPIIVVQLERKAQIEHTPSRKRDELAVNLITGLLAFTRQPRKLSLHLSKKALSPLPTLLQRRTRVSCLVRNLHNVPLYSESAVACAPRDIGRRRLHSSLREGKLLAGRKETGV